MNDNKLIRMPWMTINLATDSVLDKTYTKSQPLSGCAEHFGDFAKKSS